VIDLMGRNRDGEFCFLKEEIFLIRLFYREVFTSPHSISTIFFLTHRYIIIHSSQHIIVSQIVRIDF
jgi:hypothetical protein